MGWRVIGGRSVLGEESEDEKASEKVKKTEGGGGYRK